MFKKPFQIGQSHKVSGADRKKLRRALEKAYGASEEALEALLPAKAGELEVAKLASPSRCTLYLHDGVPVLLDPSGKGDLMPTVLGLWRAPGLLPQITIKHPAVSRYLVGGADLMLPGVALPLPPFPAGALVAVCSPGNPAPLAVGVAVLGAEEAAARAGGARPGGAKGRMVEVLQHYGDCLWADVGGRAVPNPGYLADGVVPVGVGSIAEALDMGEDADGSDGEEEEGAAEGAAAAAAAGAEGAAGALGGISLGGEEGPGAAAGSSAGTAPLADASASAAPAAPAEDMDVLLERVLLQALHKSVKDADLPLNSSLLWAQHMLPARPAGAVLDVKKTKHKKMSKFLQSYAKAGLLACKEDKHSGDVIVTAVHRGCALYADYRPYRNADTAAAEAAAAASTSGAEAAAPSAAPGGGGAAGGNGGGELVIEEVFKAGRELKPIFEELGLNPEGLYSGPEAAEAAFAYVRAAGLEAGAPDNRTITLNALLCDALFKGFLKKGELYPTHLAKADLRDAFMRRMHQQCRVRRGAQQVLRRGAPPAIALSSEKRQGNKRITKVAGLEAFLIDPDQLSSEAQRRFACSTTVGDLPGKGAGKEVMLQGSFLEPLADFIAQQYGVPKKYFNIKK